jgi:hypothetical protein
VGGSTGYAGANLIGANSGGGVDDTINGVFNCGSFAPASAPTTISSWSAGSQGVNYPAVAIVIT